MTTAEQIPFRTTRSGGRKHLAQCPYVVGATTRPVRDDEQLPTCDWCARELSGHGRRYYADLDRALEAYQAPLENRQLIEQELRHVEHDTVWIPYSGSYVALGLEGRGVAWTGKTYVVPRPGVSIPLHGSTDSARGGQGRAEQRPAVVCSTCWQERAVTGVCGCD